MRNRRFLYSNITGSERLGAVSFPAKWLWTLLVVAQDDMGSFPWFPLRVRLLTPGTPWSLREVDRLRDELIKAGLATVKDDMVTLYKGEEFNGVPKSGRNAGKSWYYALPAPKGIPPEFANTHKSSLLH